MIKFGSFICPIKPSCLTHFIRLRIRA